MLKLKELSKQYGDKVLFQDVDISFDPGKCYGLVGANGSGKSTLMRMITGQETADSGEILIPGNRTLGTLNQDHFSFEEKKILDVVIMGNRVLYKALLEKEELLEHEDPCAHRIIELEEIIAENDGYIADSMASEMLEGLGITTDLHQSPMSVLSGGFKLRVLLAQVLFSKPSILLLDEPTNHLDIISINWLETYLKSISSLVVVISHDRMFLNNVCTHIADIDYQTITIYPGDYDHFLEKKEENARTRAKEAEKAEKAIEDHQQFVTRFKAKASKARQAQSKARMIERMEKNLTEPVYSSRVYPTISFPIIRQPGKYILNVENISKSYGELQVLKNVCFNLYRGDKLAVIGPNGVGKSTLLKILVSSLQADSGEFEWGYETHVQYFAQDHQEQISEETTPYEWLYQFAPGESIGTIRGILGQFLFSNDDVHKSTKALSGGESARLILSKLHLLKGNILVLDEPTNHLDLESIESLKKALNEFEGSFILVSHSRYLIENVANKILLIQPDGIDLFEGTYREFVEKTGFDHLAEAAAEIRKKKKTLKPAARQVYNKEEEKRKNRLKKELKKQCRDLEEHIFQLEASISDIDELFSDPNYFAKTPADEIKDKNREKQALQSELEQIYPKWERVSGELELL